MTICQTHQSISNFRTYFEILISIIYAISGKGTWKKSFDDKCKDIKVVFVNNLLCKRKVVFMGREKHWKDFLWKIPLISPTWKFSPFVFITIGYQFKLNNWFLLLHGKVLFHFPMYFFSLPSFQLYFSLSSKW